MKLTKEQEKISKANHKKAAEFFKLQKGWVLHHIDTDWRYNDIERYILWDPFDLVMMTKAEHVRIHRRGKHHSEETKIKMSEAMKGHQVSEYTKQKMSESQKAYNKSHPRTDEYKKKMSESCKGKQKGKKLSEETKKRLSKANKGKKRFTNGVINVTDFVCPPGFWPGMTKHKH